MSYNLSLYEPPFTVPSFTKYVIKFTNVDTLNDIRENERVDCKTPMLLYFEVYFKSRWRQQKLSADRTINHHVDFWHTGEVILVLRQSHNFRLIFYRIAGMVQV